MDDSRRKKRVSSLERASNIQIAHMAHDAATWYKAFFLQRERFLESERGMADCFDHTEAKQGVFPFVPEKLFWIETIDHTLSDIDDLNTALLAHGDSRLKSYKEGLLDDEEFIRIIRHLRNANEHYVEYLLGIGNAQVRAGSDELVSSPQVGTALHWYFNIDGAEILGNVSCERMIERMRTYYLDIMGCLESVFNEYYTKSENVSSEESKI